MDPQIIIGGVELPECSNDNYSCWEETLDVQRDMISGRRTIETRGKVWKASYVSDYLEDGVYRRALEALRSGKPFIATVLPDNSTQTVTSTFVVERVTQPTLLAFDGSTPIWHGLGFILREENPHK